MSERVLRFVYGALIGALALAAVFPGPSGAAAAARILKLDECIAIAQKNNPDIAAAGEGYRKSESNILMNYGKLLPGFNMDFYLGHTYYGPSSVQFDTQGRPVQREGFDYPSYAFGLSSDVTLFDGGGNINRVRAAMSGRDAAREDLRYRKDLISARVIRAYYDLVRNRMLLRVQEESVDLAKRNLERTEALLSVGSATKADVLKARVRHSNTRLSMIQSTNAAALAWEELAALLNMEGVDTIDVDTTMAIEFAEPDAETEVHYAMTHRSDLRSLEHNIKSVGAGVAAARSGWFPSVGASFSYRWNDRKMAENLNFFDSEYLWGINAYLSFNIFDRFLTSSNVSMAKADYRIAEYGLEKAKLDAAKEIRGLVLTMKEAREFILVAAETVEQAGEDLRLAEERYRVGAGTMLETIDAQVALTQAKADVIRAKTEYLSAAADLARATGKGTYH
jgi:outer membrane protein TolC